MSRPARLLLALAVAVIVAAIAYLYSPPEQLQRTAEECRQLRILC